MPLHAATIGSINIDYIVDLSDLKMLDSFFLNGHVMRPIETIVGGNGSFFAEAALEAGFASSKLFTTVGSADELNPDALALTALEYLKKQKIEVSYSIDKLNQTGRVIMIYYSDNRRFVVADRSAGDSFRLDNLPPNIYELLENVDLLYVSGYGLQTKLRNEAVQTLMHHAQAAGAFTIVDIVPHQIYKSISFNEYKQLLVWANAISVEGPTLMGFLGFKNTNIDSPEDSTVIEEMLKDLCELSFVRLNDKSDFLIMNQDAKLNINIPFPPNRAGRRFMDRILAHFLKSYLSNGRSLKDTHWLNDVSQILNNNSQK